MTHEQVNDQLDTTVISVPVSIPKLLKIPALLLVLAYGLGRVSKSDMILAHSPGIASGFPGLVLAVMFNKPLIVDHMDSRDRDTPRFIYQRVLKECDVVLAISQFLESEASELGCKRIVHLPIFVDTERFRGNPQQRSKLRRELGIRDDDIVIGYAGAFVPEEGLSVLVRSFGRLSQQIPNIKLVLVGGVLGTSPKLKDDAPKGERVLVVPRQPYGLMPSYLSSFDVACSPKTDTPGNRASSPIKICEYMSMALPTIASAVGEISTVIDNDIDGFLVRPGDERDLESTLQHVVQNLDSARHVGKRAREKIVKNYSAAAMVKKVGDVLAHIGGRAA